MNLNLKLSATIELGKEDVQRLIEEAVKAQMQGYEVKGVTFETTTIYDQFDRGPGQQVFSGVKVKVVPKLKT